MNIKKRRKQSLSLILVFFFVLISCKQMETLPLGTNHCLDITVPNDMGCVPGGIFILGSNSTDWKTESYDLSSFSEHTVELSTFLIDKTEVTNQDYQACVAVGKCQPQWSNYPHLREPNQPQLKVDWYQAKAYCEAQGKRLPTEAEFEAASRGPNREMYPWGNQIANCNLAVIKDESGRGCQGQKLPGFHQTPNSFKDTGSTWDVGSRQAYRYGLYDMSGNAQEWVSDWFAPTLEACGQACLGKDPKGPCHGSDVCQGFIEKLVKGGSWYWGPIAARAASRRPHFPENKPIHHFGFRCAKSIQ